MKIKLFPPIVASLIMLICLACFSVAKAEEAIEYRFERLWPRLVQPWYFSIPSGVAVAPDGSVYITEPLNYRIQQFSAQGEFIRTWGGEGSGDGQFDQPQGVAIASDGSVYVVDSHNDRIQQFSAQGVFIRTWGSNGSGNGEFNRPEGIAIAPDGSVYVADTGNDRIQQFNVLGDFIRTWGNFGEGDGQFIRPRGVVIASNGSVYVADTVNHRIQQFSDQGDFIRTWGNEGSGDGQFDAPSDMAVASDGSVFVVDTVNHRIQQFSAQGDFIRTRGSEGSGNGQFNQPTGIAITPNGSVYVADTSNDRIQQFSAQGDFVLSWESKGSDNGQFDFPLDIAIAPDGSVYVADTVNHRIQQFNAQGDFIRTWGSEGSGNGQFSDSIIIAIASDGSVYVADRENHRIQQFNAQGDFIRTWGSEGSGNGQFSFPERIAISSDGSVYVADAGNGRVQQFSTQGDFIRTWGSFGSGNGQFSSPNGIAISPDGSVYVADFGSGRIQQFSAQGDFIRIWGNFGEGDGQFRTPDDIASAPDGSIYGVDSVSDSIQQFSAQGDLIQTVGSRGSGDGQFSSPYGIEIDSDGNLYIADTGNNRVQKFKLQNEGTSPLPHKAILLAGGGPSKGNYRNFIWNETVLLTNKAHRALRSQGFVKDEVKYLTAGNTLSDLDGNGQIDDLESASLASLQQAITGWAADATNVLIYMADHGGPGRFQVNDHEILTNDQLSTWVNQLDALIPGKVTVIIESCKSGSFFGSLAKTNRHLIASADATQPAIISNGGLNSFSYYFWGEISSGATLKEAFKTGRQGMSKQIIQGRAQNAQLDSNGDRQFNETDFSELANFCIGNCTKYASNAPNILSKSDPKTLNGETTTELFMQINSLEQITQAWVTIIPPDFTHRDSDEPVSELNKILLTCDASLRCTTQYTGFEKIGDYQVTFYAQNELFQMAIPETTTITQTQGIPVFPNPFNITARYNDQTRTVTIDDVMFGNEHYQAELIHPIVTDPGIIIFNVKSANKLDAQVLQNPNVLDVNTFALTLNKVSVFDKYYKVVMKHLGDLVFQLETPLEEVPE